jgi:very-short-patch-repair endonuclease
LFGETLQKLTLARIADKALLELAQDYDLNCYFSCTDCGIDSTTGEVMWIPDPLEYKHANEYSEAVNNLFYNHSIMTNFGRCDYLDEFVNGEYNSSHLYTFFLDHYSKYNWSPQNDDDQRGLFNSVKTINFYQNHPLCNLSEKTLHNIINKLKNDFKIDVDGYYTYVLNNRQQQLSNNIVFCAKNAAPYVDRISINPNKIKYTDDIVNDSYASFYIYDNDVPETGLGITEIIKWAQINKNLSENDLKNKFLLECSNGEKTIMNTFIDYFWKYEVPALLPQYYCRRSIASSKTRAEKGLEAIHQRADFVMFFPLGKKVIIELDDYNHFIELDNNGERIKYFKGTSKIGSDSIDVLVNESHKGLLDNISGTKYIASAKQYAANMASDRELKLEGYEVFRFGGYDTVRSDAEKIIKSFFNELFKSYGIKLRERV